MTDLDLLTTEEAARELGVTKRRVQALCQEGRLGTKVGKQYVITRAELDAYAPRPVGRPPKPAQDS